MPLLSTLLRTIPALITAAFIANVWGGALQAGADAVYRAALDELPAIADDQWAADEVIRRSRLLPTRAAQAGWLASAAEPRRAALTTDDRAKFTKRIKDLLGDTQDAAALMERFAAPAVAVVPPPEPEPQPTETSGRSRNTRPNTRPGASAGPSKEQIDQAQTRRAEAIQREAGRLPAPGARLDGAAAQSALAAIQAVKAAEVNEQVQAPPYPASRPLAVELLRVAPGDVCAVAVRPKELSGRDEGRLLYATRGSPDAVASWLRSVVIEASPALTDNNYLVAKTVERVLVVIAADHPTDRDLLGPMLSGVGVKREGIEVWPTLFRKSWVSTAAGDLWSAGLKARR